MNIVETLRSFYGLLPQPPADAFQFFVWEILSRDALPARRDLAWQALRRIPALTPDSVARTPAKDLLSALANAGPRAERRLEQLKATAGEFKRNRARLESDALEARGLLSAARALRRLTEVPREVGERALLYAAGYQVLPLDEAAARVIHRLSGQAPSRRAARRLLAQWLPRDVETYAMAVTYLRHHAQHTCVVAGPHCSVCPLVAECAYGSAAVDPSRPS